MKKEVDVPFMVRFGGNQSPVRVYVTGVVDLPSRSPSLLRVAEVGRLGLPAGTTTAQLPVINLKGGRHSVQVDVVFKKGDDNVFSKDVLE